MLFHAPFNLLLKVWGELLGICRRTYTDLPLLPHQNMPFGQMMEIHQSGAYSSSKHANSQADDRISIYTPKSARLRAGVVASPPKHDSLANGSPAKRGDEDNVLNLHPNDMLQPLIPTPQQLIDNKFQQYQTNITKTTECLASPLPVDITVCFNATYHAPLQESQEVKTLLSDINRPANIDMIVRPTNNGIYTLKDAAMYAIRNVDARLQEVQATIAKSSYVTMKLAEEMMQAHTEGHLPQRLYNVFSDHCLHTVTFNSFALQQLDQVRRMAYNPVLAPHLRSLTKLPTGKHAETFGDDLPARQKELQTKAELAASLVKPTPPPPKPYSFTPHAYRKRTKPYSRPPTATHSSNCQPTGETRPPPRGQNKLCLTPLQLLFIDTE